MNRPPAIEIEDLTVRFDNRNILNGVSMRIRAGEKVHLDGRSGSGKSTLLRSILGFVAPDDGSIRIEGHLMDGRNAWELRRCMAYVPQEPHLGTGSAPNQPGVRSSVSSLNRTETWTSGGIGVRSSVFSAETLERPGFVALNT